MVDLYLWFSEDFDKRYEEYQKKFSVKTETMPEPFLLNRLFDERESIAGIKNKQEFEDEVEKWKPLKMIVDAIYKALSPLEERPQTINLNLKQLDLSESVARPVLMTLVYERVCRWKMNTSSAVISSASVAEYLQGEGVVVQNYGQFRDFRKQINDFHDFLEQQRKEKFSEDENTTNSKQNNGEEIVDNTVKKTLKWGGEVVSDLPLIDYNEATGIGEVIGKKKFRFKDGSSEYKIFRMLYGKLGKKTAKLERQDVLVAGGFYEDYENPDPTKKTLETAFVNDVAKNIREKTGLNTEELVNNNGSLTLLALRQDKNPPKVTKFVPVWG